ncbi:MAG: hypothetical protein JKY02_03075 [Flavobacteriaceae bacterium]|nr:hypothetical protein [Flavobacteriaceae bacterium]
MKKIAFLLFLILLSNCKKSEKSELEIEKYTDIKFGKVEYEGKMLDYASISYIEKNDDSINAKISKYSRRFDYLLKNRVNIDSINKILPDTIQAKKFFKKELNKKDFIKNFSDLLHNVKNEYSKDELMNIASKFFLTEKHGNKFGTKICIGINGQEKPNNNKDYTLLEAIIFDAIFSRLMQVDQPEAKFITNMDKYQKESIQKVGAGIQDSLKVIRKSLFESMENDKDLRDYLLSYLKENENNIPIKIQ